MKKKLTIPDMFYIEQHRDKSVAELAVLVDCSEKLVEQHLAKLPANNRATTSDFGTTQSGNSNAIDKYGRRKGTVACNEAVSQHNDDATEANRAKS